MPSAYLFWSVAKGSRKEVRQNVLIDLLDFFALVLVGEAEGGGCELHDEFAVSLCCEHNKYNDIY